MHYSDLGRNMVTRTYQVVKATSINPLGSNADFFEIGNVVGEYRSFCHSVLERDLFTAELEIHPPFPHSKRRVASSEAMVQHCGIPRRQGLNLFSSATVFSMGVN